MRKLFLPLIAVFLLSVAVQAQERIIAPVNPIARFDFSYSVNDVLVATIILNSAQTTQEVNNQAAIFFEATLEGVINWKDANDDPEKKIVKSFFLNTGQSPFKWTADLKDGLGHHIKLSNQSPRWKSIDNAKISYKINGTYGETPTFTIYPPYKQDSEPTQLKIEPEVCKLDTNKGMININSPNNIPFEVEKIEIWKINDEGEASTTAIDGDALSKEKYGNIGTLSFKFTTQFPIDIENQYKYEVKVEGKEIGTNNKLSSQRTRVVFKDCIPLQILNRSEEYVLEIRDKDEIIDKDIRTIGNGKLGIEFISKDYAEYIKVDPIYNDGGSYSFRLSGLSSIPDNSTSAFYYTDGSRRIQPPHIINKKPPTLKNFQFDGVDGNNFVLSFNLPKYVDPNKILVSLSGSIVEGTANLGDGIRFMQVSPNRDNIDSTKFTSVIPVSLANFVSQDTITDITFTVKYGQNSLYSLVVKLVNQKLMSERLGELNRLIAENSRRRRNNKEQIGEVLKEIQEIAIAIGNSVSDQEVIDATDSLADGNGENIRGTMEKVGKWAFLAGKIVLPLLL